MGLLRGGVRGVRLSLLLLALLLLLLGLLTSSLLLLPRGLLPLLGCLSGSAFPNSFSTH